jgi:hypothetical protein
MCGNGVIDFPGGESMTSTTRRDLKKEAFWRAHLARQASSGLGVKDWCRQNKVSHALFYYWKGALARRDGRASQSDRHASAHSGRLAEAQSPALVSSEAQPTFARVVTAAAAAVAPSGQPIEIVCWGGCVVRVAAGFDGPTLSRVLDVLEGHSC